MLCMRECGCTRLRQPAFSAQRMGLPSRTLHRNAGVEMKQLCVCVCVLFLTPTCLHSLSQAVAAATALVESKMNKELKKFLKKNIVSKELTDELAVADAKLGGVIKDKLDIAVSGEPHPCASPAARSATKPASILQLFHTITSPLLLWPRAVRR